LPAVTLPVFAPSPTPTPRTGRRLASATTAARGARHASRSLATRRDRGHTRRVVWHP
jgi:hypothetical protein